MAAVAVALQLIYIPDAILPTDLESTFLSLMSTSDVPRCKELLSVLKPRLKDKVSPPLMRLHVLTLVHKCMLQNNPQFAVCTGEKLMERLVKLAKHREKSRDPTRGSDIFGKVSAGSRESQDQSALFLIRLLTYLRVWAKMYPENAKKGKSVFKIKVEMLEKRGVCFPEDDVIQLQPTEPAGKRSDPAKFYNYSEGELKSIYTICQEIEDLIENKQGPLDFSRFEEELTRLMPKLTTEISAQEVNPVSIQSKEQVIAAKRRVRTVMAELQGYKEQKKKEIYEMERKYVTDWEKERLKKPQVSGRKVPFSKEIAAESDEFEIVPGPQEEHGLDASMLTISDVNTENISEISAQNREIRNLCTTIQQLSEENERLMAEMSLLRENLAERTLKFTNFKKFSTVCFANSGILVDSDFIQVQLSQKTTNNIIRLALSIGNCSQNCLESFKTVFIPPSSGGLSHFFARNDNPEKLSPGAQAYIDLELTFTAYIREAPKLLFSFSAQRCAVEYEVLLPVTVFRLFSPANRDEDVLLKRCESASLQCFSFPTEFLDSVADVVERYSFLRENFQLIAMGEQRVVWYGKRCSDELILTVELGSQPTVGVKASTDKLLDGAKAAVALLVHRGR